jgi:hypothetical protein
MPEVFRLKLAETIDDNLRKNEGCPVLGASLAHQQIYPILVGKPIDGKRPIRDGHRRKYSALLVGLTELDAIEVEGHPTPNWVRQLQLRLDVHHVRLTDAQRYTAIRELAATNPRLNGKQLADLIEIDPTLLSRFQGLERLVPEALKAFMDDQISLKVAHEINQLPHVEQPKTLNLRLDGATVADLTGTRKKGGSKPSKNLKRAAPFVIAMPGQHQAILTGVTDLATARTILNAALKLIERAESDSLSLRSAQAVFKDLSRKPKSEPKEKRPRKVKEDAVSAVSDPATEAL